MKIIALFAGVWFYFSLLSAVFSFVFVYVLLADDHVSNVSYFPFMSIKKVVPYFCVLREDYYVIIWLIVRICMFIKDWKLIYSELFILKRKRMENWVFFDLSFYSDILSWLRPNTRCPYSLTICVFAGEEIQIYRFLLDPFQDLNLRYNALYVSTVTIKSPKSNQKNLCLKNYIIQQL